jgi:hypothetical protein
MRKRLFWVLAILLIGLAAAPFILYLMLPRLIQPFLEAKLKSFGCENSRVLAQKIAADGARFEEIHCLLPGRGEFRLKGVAVSYALSGLLAGSAGKILVERAEVTLYPSDPGPAGPIPIPERLFTFIPIAELKMPEIEISYPWQKDKPMKVAADFYARFHALSIEGELRARSSTPFLLVHSRFVLSGARADFEVLEGNLSLPELRASVPANTKLEAKLSSGKMIVSLSNELALTASVKKTKHDIRLKNLSVEIQERAVRAGFQIAYAGLPDIPLFLKWLMEKDEVDFKASAVTFPIAKSWPVAAGFMGEKKLPLELRSGELAITAEGRVRAGDAPSLLSLRVAGSIKSLSGSYGEYKFEEIHFPLKAEVREGSIKIEPAELSVGEFNAGIPVKNIKAGVGAEVSSKGIDAQLAAVSAEVFSGSVLMPELLIKSGRPASKFQVELKGLSLGEIIALQKQEGISGSGTIDGKLPVEPEKAGIVVRDGRLQARAPGGYIAYQPGEGLKAAADGNPGLKLAVDVLGNFQYQVLEGKVDYQASGDMNIALRLEGHNPDWSGGRPVHFNFTVSENLLKLLKSLRIADDTGSALEKRIQGQ